MSTFKSLNAICFSLKTKKNKNNYVSRRVRISQSNRWSFYFLQAVARVWLTVTLSQSAQRTASAPTNHLSSQYHYGRVLRVSGSSFFLLPQPHPVRRRQRKQENTLQEWRYAVSLVGFYTELNPVRRRKYGFISRYLGDKRARGV